MFVQLPSEGRTQISVIKHRFPINELRRTVYPLNAIGPEHGDSVCLPRKRACVSHLIISATSSVVGQNGPTSPVLPVKGVLFDVYVEPDAVPRNYQF